MDYLIVGLGNPGDKYFFTRHNIGFLAIDLLCQTYSIDVTRKYKKSLIGRGTVSNNQFFLMKPQTYMNLSGTVILSAMAKYRISPDKIIIIYDDIDLPTGKIRIRKNGGSAGHKGIQSVLDNIQNENFLRIRIGINSDKPETFPAEKYVLQNFSSDEKNIIAESLKKIPDIIDTIINNSVEKAMNDYN